MIRNCFFICLFCLLFAGRVETILAAPWDVKTKSVDEFSSGLQALVDSSVQLEATNNEAAGINADLKQRIEELNTQINSAALNNTDFEKQLDGYKDKNKDNELKLHELEDAQAKNKERLDDLDKEIAFTKIRVSERKKQQGYLLELITIAQKNGKVDLDHSVIIENQEKLKRQVKDSLSRMIAFEKEYKVLSFWYGDAAVSMPELTKIKDEIVMEIDSYKKENVSEKWAKNRNQLQTLEKDIAASIQERNTHSVALEAIENKYVTKSGSSKKLPEEQKLQANLVQLKGENKKLQKKVTDLRAVMVNLDKNKAKLEKMLGDN